MSDSIQLNQPIRRPSVLCPCSHRLWHWAPFIVTMVNGKIVDWFDEKDGDICRAMAVSFDESERMKATAREDDGDRP